MVLQKCSNHWCRIGTSQVVNSSLVNNTASNVVSLVENYQYNNCSSWITQNKGENKGTNSCAVAGNGLMYDNCQGGGKTLTNASNYCSSKNMRLPTFYETRALNSNGVPSCGSWTWTSSGGNYNGNDGSYGVWYGNSISSDGDNNSHYVRCVR